MSAQLFSIVPPIIRRHARGGQAIPLLSRYDPHERQASPVMPFLFQRKIGTNQEVISPAAGLPVRGLNQVSLAGPGQLAAVVDADVPRRVPARAVFQVDPAARTDVPMWIADT